VLRLSEWQALLDWSWNKLDILDLKWQRFEAKNAMGSECQSLWPLWKMNNEDTEFCVRAAVH